MTHDPLCPYTGYQPGTGSTTGVRVAEVPHVPCQCDFIAKVVAREREQAAQRVEALDHENWCAVHHERPNREASSCNCTIGEAARAARGEQP